MRILVLTSTPRAPDNHLLWEGLRDHAEVDIRAVAKEEQRNLRRVLARHDLSAYRRIVVDLLFRYVSRRAFLLSGIPGLVLYEEDACQNFLPHSAWHGRFEHFYRRLPAARIVCTGHDVAGKLRATGVDARFVPKGFDSSTLSDQGLARDISFGFIGRLTSGVYTERKRMLELASGDFGLEILRTEPGADYARTLNRIRTFVSADIGIGEYMAKNFEAMACGCLLLAWRQGNGEEEALGFRDDDNVLLYGSRAELLEKARWIAGNPDRANEIARRGQRHAIENFDYRKLSRRVYEQLAEPMPPPGQQNLIRRTLARWL